MTAVRKVPALSPKSDSSALSVMSYNVLAPLYVRTVDSRTGAIQPFAAFEWCKAEDLDWANRQTKLRDHVIRADADVVCLQEVEFEYVEGRFVLPAWLRELPYSSCLPAQRELQRLADRNAALASAKAVGNVILVRPAAAEIKWESEPTTTRLVVGLETAGGASLAVACVHLDANSEAKRVSTLARCHDCAAQYMGVETRLIIAGDLNTECLPGSGVYAALTGDVGTAEQRSKQAAFSLRTAEPTASEFDEWDALVHSAFDHHAVCPLTRVGTGATRSAYELDESGVFAPPCVCCALDHVLYTDASLKCVEVWQTLEDFQVDVVEKGLPSAEWPSDHLAVCASFLVVPFGTLAPERQEALDAVWEKLISDVTEGQAAAAAQLALLPAPAGLAKPTAESIEVKKLRRKVDREAKERAVTMRQNFVDSMQTQPEKAWLQNLLVAKANKVGNKI
eukprot:CAMPEP_0206818226 /NCGR_PEP_ID=MMETSP0975-20121206/10696_1 /ASSEMBLY_ACC=CAM_ASM_000399 /TAXON_ID=483370 /ORGANISM="non described non described, Strain CCMP2097" /LENGTH=450 /DNA_ID=CAMNT_0054360437 /DNA_START=27 /DNA_END=1377 /DNA_ORIENTATION=+